MISHEQFSLFSEDGYHVHQNAKWTNLPNGYYDQPQAQHDPLPGMEMSPEDHAAALGKHLNAHVTVSTNRRGVHSMMVHRIGHSVSMMDWHGYDSNNRNRTGEIEQVYSEERGDAGHMLRLAETLGREHADIYPMPKHSVRRTPQGIKWSRRQMEKRGEDVW